MVRLRVQKRREEVRGGEGKGIRSEPSGEVVSMACHAIFLWCKWCASC